MTRDACETTDKSDDVSKDRSNRLVSRPESRRLSRCEGSGAAAATEMAGGVGKGGTCRLDPVETTTTGGVVGFGDVFPILVGESALLDPTALLEEDGEEDEEDGMGRCEMGENADKKATSGEEDDVLRGVGCGLNVGEGVDDESDDLLFGVPGESGSDLPDDLPVGAISLALAYSCM